MKAPHKGGFREYVERVRRPQQVIEERLRDLGLALGGLVVLNDVVDDFVRVLVRSLNAIRVRTLRRLDEEGGLGDPGEPTVGTARPHPAIQQFLARVRRRRG